MGSQTVEVILQDGMCCQMCRQQSLTYKITPLLTSCISNGFVTSLHSLVKVTEVAYECTSADGCNCGCAKCSSCVLIITDMLVIAPQELGPQSRKISGPIVALTDHTMDTLSRRVCYQLCAIAYHLGASGVSGHCACKAYRPRGSRIPRDGRLAQR